jgi:enoyl-CoA hydratase/carnithine racemase
MLERIPHDDILELKLARPPVNALSPELLRELRVAVASAPGTGAKALVISANPGLFSAGLDVPHLLTLDRAGMLAMWEDLHGLLAAIACSTIPTVAAITGHSPAGGTVIALNADYRVMADGPFKLGLNETQVGLTLPRPILASLQRLVGYHRAERHIVAGNMIDPAEALRIGLVDELAPPEQVVERALAWCRFHLALPARAMRLNREAARADLKALYTDPAQMQVDVFLDGWFHPETQSVLKALVARLKAKA